MVLDKISWELPAAQMQRLLKEGRIRFCPSVTGSMGMHKNGGAFDRAAFFSSFASFLPSMAAAELSAWTGLIDEHLLVGDYGDFSRFHRVFDEALTEFDHVAARKGYEHLTPPLTMVSSPGDRRAGLTTGLARMNDLAVAGVTEMQMDKELPVLLEICYPGTRRPPASDLNAALADAIGVVEQLHNIHNLPSPGKDYLQSNGKAADLVDTLLSDEASELRQWLHAHWRPGLDVRDAYAGAEARLRSKSAWTSWIRFGAVAAAGSVAGAFFDNPVAGAFAGAAIGAVNQQFGDQVIARAIDPYHPARWLSYVEKN